MEKFLNANITISKFCNKYNELRSNLPIRPSEMGVLNIITKREGRFTPLMLAELLEVSKPMVTAHISRLEKLGYVCKEHSQEDKRSFYIIPTDKAKQLVVESGRDMKKKLEQLENCMGEDDFKQLTQFLNKANKILKDME